MTEANGATTGKETTNGEAARGQQLSEDLIFNIVTSRSQLFQRLMDPRRNIEDECGYPQEQASIDVETYRRLYDREAIAARVVQVMPKESWQKTPLVYEDEDPERSTPFEEAWDALAEHLSSGRSWHQDEEGSPVWEHLQRADELSGIGHFGILLMGFDDGGDLSTPVEGAVVANGMRDCPLLPEEREALLGLKGLTSRERFVVNSLPVSQGLSGGPATREVLNRVTEIKDLTTPGYLSPGDPYRTMGTDAMYFGPQLSGPSERMADEPSKRQRKLLFLRAFDESLVQIVRYEWNAGNPRFGQPVLYRVTLNDPREQHGGIGLPMATVMVHWSRVIHLADNRGSSEIFGVPRMRPVLNRLLDLRKLYGGSAEMYWRGAFPGISFETHPQLGGDVQVDRQKLRDMHEEYANGLQRALFLIGMTAKTLSPTVVDPTSQVNVQLEAICIQLGIPIRVFKGSERGELASSQDDASWNDRLRSRQHSYVTPSIIVPFVDRLIACGVLPEPGVGKGRNLATAVENMLRRKGLKVISRTSGAFLVTNGLGQVGKIRVSSKCARGWLVINAGNGKEVGFVAKGGYTVEWPDLNSLNDQDRATIGSTQTTALAAYVAGNVETIVPPLDYLTEILGLSDEKAQTILDNAAKAHEDQDTMTMPPAGELGHPATPKPPPPPPLPPGAIKVKPGEKLVHPPPPPAWAGKAAGQTPPAANVAGADRLHDSDDDGEDAGGSAAVPTTDNSFCPTGPGGGIDPSCSPSAGGASVPAGGHGEWQGASVGELKAKAGNLVKGVFQRMASAMRITKAAPVAEAQDDFVEVHFDDDEMPGGAPPSSLLPGENPVKAVKGGIKQLSYERHMGKAKAQLEAVGADIHGDLQRSTALRKMAVDDPKRFDAHHRNLETRLTQAQHFAKEVDPTGAVKIREKLDQLDGLRQDVNAFRARHQPEVPLLTASPATIKGKKAGDTLGGARSRDEATERVRVAGRVERSGRGTSTSATVHLPSSSGAAGGGESGIVERARLADVAKKLESLSAGEEGRGGANKQKGSDKPAHFGRKGAAAINAQHAAEHLAGGGTVHTAVQHVMKHGGVGEGTARRYVRAAVKQAASEADAKVARAKEEVERAKSE